MKGPSTMRLAVLALAACTTSSTFAQTAAPTAQPWTQIPIPPLHAFQPQQPKRIELA